MDYQDLFDKAVSGEIDPEESVAESTHGETDYHALFGNVMKATEAAAKRLTVTPIQEMDKDVNKAMMIPNVGLGGVVALGQGKSLEDAAQGIQQGKSVGSYVGDAVQPPADVSPGMRTLGRIGAAGAGVVTDMGVQAGLTEGLMGSGVRPLVNVDLDAPRAPETPSLGRGYDAETTTVPNEPDYQSTFDQGVKVADTKPGDYKGLFENLMEDPKAERRIAPSMDGNGPTSTFHEPGEIAAAHAANESDVLRPDNIIERTKDRLADESGEVSLGNPAEPYKKGDVVHIKSDKPGMPEMDVSYNGPLMLVSDEFAAEAGYTPDQVRAMRQPTFNLTEDMPKDGKDVPHPKDSTLSLETLENRGYKISPPTKASEAANVIIPDNTDLAAKLDVSGQYDPVQNIKAGHFGDLNAKSFEDTMSIRDVTKDLSPAENAALRFVAENSPAPASYAKTQPEVASLIAQPSQKMVEALPKYKTFMEQKATELKASGAEFNEITDYAPHILNYPIEKQASRTGKQTGGTPFTTPRVNENLAKSMDAGYTLKHDSTSQDMQAYADSVNRAVASKQLAKNITTFKLPNGEPLAYPKTAQRLPTVIKDGNDLTPLLKDFYFTPKVFDQLKFMKGLEKPGDYSRAYDMVAAALKKVELTLSVFHHLTLSESALSLGVNPIKLARTLVESYRVGGAGFIKPELTKDALKHGLVMGGTVDIEKGLIHSTAATADKALNYALSKVSELKPGNYVSRALKPLVKAEALLDQNLWAHFQPAIKLLAYEHNVAVALGSKKFSHLPVEVLKRQVADVVNSFAGGQQWELIFDSPGMQKGLHRALLALDWTVSNMRIPLALPDPSVKGFAARRAYFKMALLFMGVTEAGNYINHKVQEGEGKFTWQNDPGHKFDMWLYKDDKGMNHYATVNKGFVEPFRWLSNPAQEFAHKMNPLAQIMFEQMSGHTVGGYDLDFAKPGNRLKAVTDKVKPFSMGTSSLIGALPTSQGISKTKLKEALETALYKNDEKTIEELKSTAMNNGINAGKFNRMKKQLQWEIKGKAKYEAERDAKPGVSAQYFKKMTGTTLGEILSSTLQSALDKARNIQRAKAEEMDAEEQNAESTGE